MLSPVSPPPVFSFVEPSSVILAPRNPLRPIAIWLLCCAAMIFVMAVIGAITRLTESGLSIVRWHALSDMLPPLDAASWQVKFDQYQQTPEYQKLNHGMALDDFKAIYFWEWLHRLWGRLIGIVYVVPLVYFAVRRQIPKSLAPRLIFFLIIGGLQGFVGWYMVKSGLIDQPRVSHYRLALHLGIAVWLFALLWRQALEILYPRLSAPTPLIPYCVKRHSVFAILSVAITMLWGVFVAGLDAGLVYNEFPLMGGKIMPSDALGMTPIAKNFFDNPVMVQFIHRWLAITSFVLVLSLGIRCLKIVGPSHVRKLGAGLIIAIIIQVGLGISTLLSGVKIPLAALHQAGALTVLALLLWENWELRRYPLPLATINSSP